ncbi:MAG: LPXTG cell wall anchor domain-containing protein, partial [Bifidobacteriaceae bacterium]|nr:LPXTG cell wall anchor domain-containing protein [Bifidobacteriaceae bacterium]
VKISRDVTYVSNKTGEPVQPASDTDVNTTTVQTQYDPTSHAITGFSNVPSDFDYPEVTSPSVDGYAVDTPDATMPGLSSTDLQKILTDNQDKLFDGNNTHGMRVDVKSDGTVTVTEDDKLPAGSINVVYHQVTHYNPASTVKVSRDVTYVSNEDGKAIADPTETKDFNSASVTTNYDQDSHAVKDITTVPGSFNYGTVDTPSVPGYTVNHGDETLPGLSSDELQKILDQNKDKLFASDAKHGYRVDVTKDGDSYKTTLTEDDTLKAGDVNVVYHQVAHFNPIYTIDQSRETTYVDNMTGERVTSDKSENKAKTTIVTTIYDGDTHQVTSVTDLPSEFGYSEENTPSVDGYKVEEGDSKLDGPSQADIQKILTDHEVELFSPSHTTGMRVDITKDGDHYDVKISEDPTVAYRHVSVVYHETAHFNPNFEVSISRETSYKSTATGEDVQKPSTSTDFNTTTISTTFDHDHKITGISTVPSDFGYSTETTPEVDGYTIDKSSETLEGPSDSDIQKILTDHETELFASHEHGMRVDVTKDGDSYKVVVTEDDTLPAGKISVVYHQTADYNPLYTLSINRNTDYVGADGSALKDPTSETNLSNGSVTVVYDPITHKVISVGTLPDGFGYTDFNSPEISGYNLNPSDKTIAGPTAEELAKILDDHKDEIFNVNHKYGVRVDITKDGDQFIVTVTEDSSLEKGTVSIFFHETVHYSPIVEESGNTATGSTSSTTTVGAGTATGSKAQSNAKTLPQTGNDSKGSVIGLALASVAGLMGLTGTRKKKQD